MIERGLTKGLEESLLRVPVVALLGSRQVGKTTLAQQICSQHPGSVYLDLERPSDLRKLSEPELYLEQFNDSLVILDEIQRVPEIFQVLRPLIDDHRTPGRFLILGSASPSLLRQSSESLAGRIRYLEVMPLAIPELKNHDWKELWVRGGYPDSVLHGTLTDSFQWREDFVTTFVERDLPQLGIEIRATSMRQFLGMLAHTHGQLLNANKIASSLGVAQGTVQRYIDIGIQSYMLANLAPLHANLKKRLVKSPKVYVRDSGILHSFHSLESYADLTGHPIAGSSFEGFVLQQLRYLFHRTPWELSFFRTAAGAEIDIVLTRGQRRVAVEVKLSLDPHLTKGFRNAYSDLECERGYVVYPGDERYPLDKNNIVALPIQDIEDILTDLES